MLRPWPLAPILLMLALVAPTQAGPAYRLQNLGGYYSSGWAVNDSGQVVGSQTYPGGNYHPFLSGPNGGSLEDLGTFGGTAGSALAINASGQVVGWTSDADGTDQAFVTGAGGKAMTPLVSLP